MTDAAEPARPGDDHAAGARPADELRSPLSLERLREAFASMLGSVPSPAQPAADASPVDAATGRPDERPAPTNAEHDPCPISPRSIVEALLFVGRPDNRGLSAREMAAVMRDVSPREVETAVDQLNRSYAAESSAWRVVASSDGYRLALHDAYERLQQKFQGRVREARLSPAAVEVLALVAYHQPVTLPALNELRGSASGAALATLVRRGLVRLERPALRPQQPEYRTTDRFLRVFGLASLAELPRGELVA